MQTRVKTETEILNMRKSGQILAQTLQELKIKTKPGVSALELDKHAQKIIKKLGGQPAFLNYEGYPAAICVSLNSQLVHGMPKAENIIKDGDVVSLDAGVTYQGMITDAAITFVCGSGKLTPELNRLISGTEEATAAGIKAVKSGCRVGDISAAVEEVLNKNKLGVVRDLVGHGVGHEVHEEPNIPNFGKAGTGPKLVAGMTIAIEPMATLGGPSVKVDPDGWTILTADGSLAAHVEHTVLITKDGCEILTRA